MQTRWLVLAIVAASRASAEAAEPTEPAEAGELSIWYRSSDQCPTAEEFLERLSRLGGPCCRGRHRGEGSGGTGSGGSGGQRASTSNSGSAGPSTSTTDGSAGSGGDGWNSVPPLDSRRRGRLCVVPRLPAVPRYFGGQGRLFRRLRSARARLPRKLRVQRDPVRPDDVRLLAGVPVEPGRERVH